MESLTRVNEARRLWERTLTTRYLDVDPYERSVETISPLLNDIRVFLKDEHVRYEDRPNAARSLALVIWQLPFSDTGAGSVSAKARQHVLEMGLYLAGKERRPAAIVPPLSDDPAFESILSRISTEIAAAGDGHVAGTGPYSSIYAALLALLLDDVTIREQLNLLSRLVELPEVVRCFTSSFLKPGPVFPFLTQYWRGQRQNWPPFPKSLRPSDRPTAGLARFGNWMRGLVAVARFGAGIGQLGLPKLTPIQLEALRQHYGFPTPLLDFTENLQVAAFFATDHSKGADIGVVYRYHLAHLYAQDLQRRLRGIHDRDPALRQRANIVVTEAAKGLTIVDVPGVERISRQEGVFVHVTGLWAAHNYFQPVFFHQHVGLSYTDASRNITKAWLLPDDDAINKVADPIVKKFFRGGKDEPRCK